MMPQDLNSKIKRNLDLTASGLLLLFFYCSLAVAPPTLWEMDSQLLVRVLAYSNPTLDMVARFLTEIGNIPFWLLMAGLLWLRRKRRAAALLVLGLLADVFMASFLKMLFARPRPYETIPETPIRGAEPGGSFPSGHTERTFVSARVLSRFLTRWKWILFGLGVLVAFTRVLTANHYPLDTLAGAVNGIALGTVLLRAPIEQLQVTLENYSTRLTGRFKTSRFERHKAHS